jgi:hypothetical protein
MSRLTPPVPVPRDGEVVLGRGQECGLVLAHSAVSRRHAALRVRGGQLTLVDLGSSNGTYLEGRRIVEPSPVKIGDSIEVGPFKLSVTPAVSAPATSPERALDLSDTSDFVPVPEAELSGRIGKVGLAEVLQVIELYEKTGTLHVEARDAAGRVVVVGGRPITASYGAVVDHEAVRELLRLQAGSFRFVADVDERVKTTMSGTLSRVILEAARTDDERRRARERQVDADAQAFFDLNAVFVAGEVPHTGEGTRILSREKPCRWCGAVVDHLARTCAACGAALHAPRR